MTETLPEPQMEWHSPGKEWAIQGVHKFWEENGKRYRYEYTSKNPSAAKRMKTRTEKWSQRYVDNGVKDGYEIIIRPQYRQHELWHTVYCRWTEDMEKKV